MDAQIPLIDIARLDRPQTRQAIDAACRDWGFFQVVGHALDAGHCQAMMATAREFFAQPTSVKQALRRDAVNPWGYFDEELTKNRRDWKEIYDYGPADGMGTAPRWPDGPFGRRFQAAILGYHAACASIATRLLATVVSNLGADPGVVLRDFGAAQTSFLRLNHYPPQPASAASGGAAPGVGEHTDSGALTVLLQDRQPGLEVQRGGRWHLVQPMDGALVVNIGDIVQVWSNDQYRAAVHRVITDPTRDRYSLPFFLNPSYDASYAPFPSTVTERRPARYRRIDWREFRAQRAAGDYADLGEEIQIHHFRIEEH